MQDNTSGLDAVQRAACLDLKSFIDASPTPWHAGANLLEAARERDYVLLSETAPWALEPGKGYAVVRDQSSVILFQTPSEGTAKLEFRVIGAHTDSPGFRIKPHPLQRHAAGDRLGVEIYGGPIVASFADRDLTLAGRVFVRSEKGTLEPRLLAFGHALLRLPTPAIHLNRAVNKDGLRFDLQDELVPVLTGLGEALPDTDAFRDLLAAALAVPGDRIETWELAVVDTQPAGFFGVGGVGLASARLDNLASCEAGLHALLASDPGRSGPVCRVLACFDHEEVGSQSFKGADGPFLADTLARISAALGQDGDQHRQALARSFVISADMAHAQHPAFQRFHDSGHPVLLNAGPVIKINANERYASDGASAAVFQVLCRDCEVPFQTYVHRNDLPCGSTIGPITAARLGVRCVDVGNAMWSMHSAREATGALDQARMRRVLTHFYQRPRLPLATAAPP